MITPHKKPPNGELSEAAQEANKSVNQIRQVVEQTIAHIKAWRIHSHRLPPPPVHIRTDHHRRTLTLRIQNHPLNKLHRVYADARKKFGRLWSRAKPSGPLQSQLDLALNPTWGNTADNVVTIRVPPGTLIYEGVAAPQPISGGSSYLGGGNQVIIPKVRGGWELP